MLDDTVNKEVESCVKKACVQAACNCAYCRCLHGCLLGRGQWCSSVLCICPAFECCLGAMGPVARWSRGVVCSQAGEVLENAKKLMQATAKVTRESWKEHEDQVAKVMGEMEISSADCAQLVEQCEEIKGKAAKDKKKEKACASLQCFPVPCRISQDSFIWHDSQPLHVRHGPGDLVCAAAFSTVTWRGLTFPQVSGIANVRLCSRFFSCGTPCCREAKLRYTAGKMAGKFRAGRVRSSSPVRHANLAQAAVAADSASGARETRSGSSSSGSGAGGWSQVPAGVAALGASWEPSARTSPVAQEGSARSLPKSCLRRSV